MKLTRRQLMVRMRGDDVELLQKELKLLGYSIRDRKGFFGRSTKKAVRKFQEISGLETTGVVDQSTARLINEAVDKLQRGLRRKYRIHPGIGIGRLGNAKTDYYIGPEVSSLDFQPEPDGNYRDARGKIRRQAQRFRIYEYTYSDNSTEPQMVREITWKDAEIHWEVELSNRKPFVQNNGERETVPLSPGVKAISGLRQSLAVSSSIFGTSVQLGTLSTDNDGRLLVLGGFGKSDSPDGAPLVGLYSPGWYDDVSDGPVRASIQLRDTGERPAVEAAWVIIGVPAYATPIINIVTLYDLIFQKSMELPPPHRIVPPTEVSFTKDIFPILQRTALIVWTSGRARGFHDFLNSERIKLLRNNDSRVGSAARNAREAIFSRVNNPTPPPSRGSMPLLTGLTVTPYQYTILEKWSKGDFLADWNGAPKQQKFDALSPQDQVVELEKAALGSIVGGSFHPGIEVGAMANDVTTYERPFRINTDLLPGALTESLSIPWQADFRACGTGWWPGGRPNSVTADGTQFYDWIPQDWDFLDTVENWWKLGFIKKKVRRGNTVYTEAERKV